MKRNIILTLFVFSLSLTYGWTQNIVTGVITDGTDPLIGVNVIEVGTTNGTITDIDGKYSINVPEGASVVFSLIGYDTKTMNVNGQSIMDLIMSEGIQLDEVVVTALGISRDKKALGYAITEVNGSDLTDAKESNVINQLAGRVAGLSITQSSAGPGSGSRVIIRGNNSLEGNNQPLYVIDGIPVDNSGFGTANGNGTANFNRADYGTGISDINADDIESMSVLKGPNAAALYGSRAANGVILITTKKGITRKGLGVSYSTHYDISSPMILPDFQNEYGQGRLGLIPENLTDIRNASGSWGPKLDGSDQLSWVADDEGNAVTKAYSPQPDNIKDFFRNGSNFVNTLAVEGGNDAATFRFSYSNTDAKSILVNSGLKRHNFNLRASSQVSDRLALDAKVTYFTQDAKNRPEQGTEGLLSYLYRLPRNVVISDLENYQNESDYSANAPNALGTNPYWILNNDRNDDTRNRIQGFAKATYKFTDHLSLLGRIGTDRVNQSIETVQNFGHWFYGGGRFNYRDYNTAETNADILLMYNNKLTDDIGLDLNVGANRMFATSKSQGVKGDDFKIPTSTIVDNAKNKKPFYNPLAKKRIHSAYASASLSYRNFLYLDLTGRNDWSSTLPKDNWSYFYPSASLSFVFSELINNDFVDFGKVRFSTASVGSDTDPYKLKNVYSLDAQSYKNLTVLSTQQIERNPNLKPETTKSIEVGLEMRAMNNRLYTDITYYTKNTNDLITTVPVAAATGYKSKFTNVGNVKNAGIEVMLGFVPVKTTDFTWDMAFNFSKNKNTLVELFEGLDNFVFSTTNAGNVTVQATVDGSEVNGEKVDNAGYGDIYGTTYMKNDAGRVIVDDTGRPIATSEKVYLGNYQPDWFGGFNNVISYKSLSFRFLIDARIGGQLYSGTDNRLDGNGVSKRSLEYREDGVIVDGVVNTGTAEEPVWEENALKITGQEYWGATSGIASNYIYDQTNIRMREMSLNYTLPTSLFSRGFVQSASIGLVGRNLFFFSNSLEGFDPESSYSTSNFAQGMLWFNLPSTKSYGINLNVKF